MSAFLLGIDYGTGGAKACIIDDELNVLSYAYREYPVFMDKHGWAENDVQMYWRITCETIQECIKKADINPGHIKGIGTSSALPCLVMVDADLQPINRAYNLLDRRATKEVAWLIEHIGEKRIFQLTANRLEDHPSIVNLMWERNNRPESFRKIWKALTIDGYIRLKLTGKATVNYSNASFYGVAYNLRTNAFDQGILAEIGIDPAILPEAFPCQSIVGQVTGAAASETGLSRGTPVAAGQADACAGWVGAGAIEVGDTQLNLGTCGVVGIVHQETTFLDTMINFPYTVDNTYINIFCTQTGGQLLRYMRDNCSPLEVAMEDIVESFSAYDYLNMQAENINIGSDGLVVLPYLAGERTPIWDVDARGVVFGLALHHTKAHIVRAMMESVAFGLYHSYNIVKNSGIQVNVPIVFNEGGVKSKLWRRIITDLFDVPTVLVKERVGAPYGDAILAGVSVGMFEDYTIAKERAVYIDAMEPVRENHEQYMPYYAIFRNLYDHLKDDFKDLAKLTKPT
ncbi:FGGY-family carbohydrate kinase [Chloroflexota bacterium]